MACGCNKGSSDWIWIVVVVVAILILTNDNSPFGSLFGGDCGCENNCC